jgi:hypothetical protein
MSAELGEHWIQFLFFSIITLIAFERTLKTLKKLWGVKMWEILVPASNKTQEFTYEHHKAWDEFVIHVSGGITIMKTVKGEWVSPDNLRFKDRMIPVRIKCTRKEMLSIIKFTISHYQQEAVLAYKLSDEVILKSKEKLSE